MGQELNASLTAPGVGGAAITPSDTADLGLPARAIYIGGGGNIKLKTVDGSILTFAGLVAGTILPVRALKVYSTDTTATSLVALW